MHLVAKWWSAPKGKSSFHSQCKFETGMEKKSSQDSGLSECPFFDMGFSRFMRLGSGLKRPWGSLGFLSMLSFFYFDDIQAKGFFSDCLPFKKNLQFPFRLFRNSAFHPFNKSVMSWTESRSGARCKNNSSVLWIMVIYTRHHTLSFPLKSFLLLNAAAEATLNFLKFTQLSKFTQRRS